MGVQISKNNGGYLYLISPGEQLMKMLVDKTRTVGHMLSFREARDDPEMADPNNYAFYFGSFNEAAQIAWKKAQKIQQKTDTSGSSIIIPNSHQPISGATSKSTGTCPAKTPKQSKTTFRSSGRPQQYSYEQLRDKIIAFYRRNGRLPTQEDVSSDPSLPSWATLYKHLGKSSGWGQLIPSELREKPTSPDDINSTIEYIESSKEESLVNAPKEEPQAVTPNEGNKGEPIINTQHRWKGDTMYVMFTILKPGNLTPIQLTIAV